LSATEQFPGDLAVKDNSRIPLALCEVNTVKVFQ